MPVAFLGGLTGQLYKQFALTLAISVILSAICALTFTPAMCALLLERVEEEHAPRGRWPRFFRGFNRAFERGRARYVRSLATMERHSVMVMLTFVLMLGAVYYLVSTRPSGLVPPRTRASHTAC